MSERPCMVTVVCITYNQEQFIAEALESFVAQKTDFRFQIFVGEDCGTDGTKDIVLDYAERYPDLIVPFIREENMGAQRNLIDLCQRAGTPYVALCEGDDYWTDENKLQKQFDLMEAHPEYRACVHATEIIYDDDWYLQDTYDLLEGERIILPFSKRSFSFERDVIDGTIEVPVYVKSTAFHTSSYFFRWNYDLVIPEWYYEHFAGDHSLLMMQVGDGKCGVLTDVMSRYRRSEVGVYFYRNLADHYFHTGFSWALILMDLRDFFDKTYGPDYCRDVFQDQIAKVGFTYFRMARALSFLEKAFEPLENERFNARRYELLDLYLKAADEYRTNYVKMEDAYGERGVELLVRGDEDLQQVVSDKVEADRQTMERDFHTKMSLYTEKAEVEKDPLIWAFSCDGYRNYTDNARHLFEYILAYHPEIQPIWVTRDKKLLEFGRAENLPMVRYGTDRCTNLLSRAAVAFFNANKITSYRVKGFNKNTKVVKLGTGFHLEDTRYRGRYTKPEFKPGAEIREVERFFRQKHEDVDVTEDNIGFFTERQEDLFLAVVQSEHMMSVQRDFFKTPADNIMLCGCPRSQAVPDNKGDASRRILFVPALDAVYYTPERFTADLFDSIDAINEKLAEMNVFMDVFVRRGMNADEKKKVSYRLGYCSHMEMLATRDLFAELVHYEALICGFDNIMYDYLLLDRPIVVLNPAKDKIVENVPLYYDYDEMIPGVQVFTWGDALVELEACLENPTRDAAIRKRVKDAAYDYEEGGMDFSEQIIQEIKGRLGV